MNTLSDYPSDAFSDVFKLDAISCVYEKEIAWKNIKGIDRVSAFNFDQHKITNFEIINRKCLNGLYKFSPYLEKLSVKDRNTPPRLISIATIRDRLALILLKEYLHIVFKDCVNRKLPNNYIKDIKDYYLSHDITDLCIYKIDIENYYNSIEHNKLISILNNKILNKPELLIIKRAISTPTVPKNFKQTEKKTYKNTIGVPQGLAISNILANIYLHEFDQCISTLCDFYCRYVDDILIISKKTEMPGIIKLIDTSLNELGLSKNMNKTKCNPIKSSIDYLGYRLCIPKVTIKDATVERYLCSLSALFSTYARKGPKEMYPKVNENVGKELFISDVNEKITGAISENKKYGWLFYFLEITDLTLLYKIDNIIRNNFIKRIKNTKDMPNIKDLKKLSRAYHEAKNSPSDGYIMNYNIYDTIAKKLDYLKYRGIIKDDDTKTYTEFEIDRLFNKERRDHLADLESDVGKIS